MMRAVSSIRSSLQLILTVSFRPSLYTNSPEVYGKVLLILFICLLLRAGGETRLFPSLRIRSWSVSGKPPVHHELCVPERQARKEIVHTLFIETGTETGPVHEGDVAFGVIGCKDTDMWCFQQVKLISRLCRIVSLLAGTDHMSADCRVL